MCVGGLGGRGPKVSEEVEPALSSHGVSSVQKDAVGVEDLKGVVSGQWEGLVPRPRGEMCLVVGRSSETGWGWGRCRRAGAS